MPHSHPLNRRVLLGAGLAAAPLLTTAPAAAAPPAKSASVSPTPGTVISATAFGIWPAADRDQTAALQSAINQTSAKGLGLSLPPGIYIAGGLMLRPGTRLIGAPGATVLRYSGVGVGIMAEHAAGIRIEHVRFDGDYLPLDRARSQALLQFTDCSQVMLNGVHIATSSATGLHLIRCAGALSALHIDGAVDAGLWSLDADQANDGLTLAHSTITNCRDNGVLIWRSATGADGTQISNCTVARIGNRSGGSGQYGNGINVYRAGCVSVSASRITDCAYSAIRGNAASNIQMLGNHVARIGEVALYAEFGFEGALIANNIVDGAATGIAVTNFNEGGRLAVVQGNIVRNLVRREHEAVDKRGEGIAVEADAVVANNVIEGAPTAGIMIGWGPHMRDVAATGNVIRTSRIGIAVSGDKAAGQCLIANNLISGHSAGAIRAMDHAVAIGGDLVRVAGPKHITLSGNVG